MEIIVCVKRVSEIVGEPVIPDEHSISEERLVFDLNEVDSCALEEAVLIKEKFGGSVTAVTVGGEECEMQLRKCLALGADKALRLDDESFIGSDGYAIARILCAAIRNLQFNLILAGCVASDNGYSQVGVQLAQLLGIPHVSLTTKIEVSDGIVRVHRELEDGQSEVLDISLPAVVTVQTGINKPRYASFRMINEAKKKEIKVLSRTDLGLNVNEVGYAGSGIKIERLFIPSATKGAHILEGTPDEKAGEMLRILKEKGLMYV